MHAVVYHGPGKKSWEEVPDPKLADDGDATVRITSTTICGTDLHILNGDVPAMTPGRILGHEAVGTVTETGPGIRSVKQGDHVLLGCISACGRCRYCRERRHGQCIGGGGWIFGHLIDGVQAELARVPFVDTSTSQIPEGLTDEQVLYLADSLPTGYEVGVLNGQVQPGDVVAVVGAGMTGARPHPRRRPAAANEEARLLGGAAERSASCLPGCGHGRRSRHPSPPPVQGLRVQLATGEARNRARHADRAIPHTATGDALCG